MTWAQVTVNSDRYPSEGYTLDFGGAAKVSTDIIHPLVELTNTLGFNASMTSNGLMLSDYKNGYTLLPFAISLMPMSPAYEILQTEESIVTLTVKFKEALTQAYSMYCVFITQGDIHYNSDQTLDMDFATAMP